MVISHLEIETLLHLSITIFQAGPNVPFHTVVIYMGDIQKKEV
jgi:hypothetical protein